MSTFSVFSREHDPTDDASADSQSAAVVSYRRPEGVAAMARKTSPAPLRTPRGAAQLEVLSLDEGPLPEVMLQLPDLTDEGAELNAGQPRLLRAWQFVQTWSYWLFVGVGALVAIVLITTGKKAPPPPMDEAPSWTPPSVQMPESPQAGVPAQAEFTPAAQVPAVQPAKPQQTFDPSQTTPTWNGPGSDGQQHMPARRPAAPTMGYAPAGTSQASEPSAPYTQDNGAYPAPGAPASPSGQVPPQNTAIQPDAGQAPQDIAPAVETPAESYQDRYRNRYRDTSYEDTRYTPGSTATEDRYTAAPPADTANRYAPATDPANPVASQAPAATAAGSGLPQYQQPTAPATNYGAPATPYTAANAAGPSGSYAPSAANYPTTSANGGAAPPYSASGVAVTSQPSATTAAPYSAAAAPATAPTTAYNPNGYYAPAAGAVGAPSASYPPAGAAPGANVNPNAMAPPMARTARGSAPAWDGTSSTVPPGGALPPGNNPSVP